MSKYALKIWNCLLLFIIGIALIGVNVTRLSCCHSDNIHWEVKIVPQKANCPCNCDCCPCESHDHTRHDFYKITDLSRIEQGTQLEIVLLYLPECTLQLLPKLYHCQEIYFPFPHKVPDIFCSRELLCTYLC